MDKKQIAVLVPARGGSKGIPYKNIKNFANLPLIAHTINYAKSSKYVNNIIISTDDEKIESVVKNHNVTILKRPKKLATDHSTTESVIEHFLNKTEPKPDIIILLQATSPYRPHNSLDEAIEKFINKNYDSFLSLSPTSHFFWKIKNNTVTAEYDYINRPRRQDMLSKDLKFIENGSLYIFKREHFEKIGNRLGGKIGYVIWDEKYSMEIDTPLQFKLLENIYKENLF
tara:strand:- start:7660 stop:8343 length:684 start_codon:yes stop_codon:yes gene_type:complete